MLAGPVVPEYPGMKPEQIRARAKRLHLARQRVASALEIVNVALDFAVVLPPCRVTIEARRTEEESKDQIYDDSAGCGYQEVFRVHLYPRITAT